jgi:formylmethanofuran dehydrogenase subunit C
VNIIGSEVTVEGDDGDWLGCDLPQGFEWKLPAGKITPVVGDPIYISSIGEQMSRAEYLVKYNVDPEVAYQMMRGTTLREQMRVSRVVSKSVKTKETSALLGSVRKLMYK